jgi:autotransporter-associated beta strand protein
VVKNGTGNWSLSGANSSYTGSTTINTGVLRTLATNAISPTSTVYIAKVGTLSLNADQTIANLQDGAGGGGTLTRLYDGTSVLTVQSGLFSGVIKDANVSRLIALTKSTGGTLTLSGLNTYTGATTVTGGTLAISAGNINGTSGITINGGELKYNSATALTKAITFTSGKISGTGAINTAVTVGTGATLAPCNSPGSQTYSSLAWTTGGAYQWETNSKTGTAGTDWDLLNVTGALDISGLDGSNKFTIDITGLAGVGDAPAASTTWTILDYDSLTGTFSAEMFTLAPTGFNGTWNSANWSIGNNTSNGSLELTYVPEPAGLALLLVGAVGLLRRRRA